MAITPPQHLLGIFWNAYQWLFWQILPTYREDPSLWVTSWWRDPWNNATVGGHPESQHLYGLALDFDSSNLCQLEENLQNTDLVVVREQTHVHVQVYPAGMLGQLGFFSPQAKRELLGFTE